MIETLISLGLNEIQSKVWLAVRQYRLSPASQIGAITGMERTHAYKILLQLQEKNLISSSLRGKTSYFYVPDKSVLKSLIDEQYQTRHDNKNRLTDLETQLDTIINPALSLLPPLRQWTGAHGVHEGLHDVVQECLAKGIKQVCFFGSKTFESIATSTETIGEKWKDFFADLQSHHISLSGYEGTGILLLENIVHSIDMEELQSLPTGIHAIQVIIVGIHIYYILYRREPVMLKITSNEISELMRALLERK